MCVFLCLVLTDTIGGRPAAVSTHAPRHAKLKLACQLAQHGLCCPS